MTFHSLTEFCSDVANNGELVRCCSCYNTLSMSGNDIIETIEGKIIPYFPEEPVEGMVCETCVAAGRRAEKAALIYGDIEPYTAYYFMKVDLETAP